MGLGRLNVVADAGPLIHLAEIDGLPDQLARAYEMGVKQASESRFLRETWILKQVVIAGLGGSAIGADLLAAYVSTPLDASAMAREAGPHW